MIKILAFYVFLKGERTFCQDHGIFHMPLRMDQSRNKKSSKINWERFGVGKISKETSHSALHLISNVHLGSWLCYSHKPTQPENIIVAHW